MMNNTVKFKLKDSPAGLSSIDAVVMNKAQDTILWSGRHATTGGDVELNIGTAGTGGQNVWVYGNNVTTGAEAVSQVFGGYSVIESNTTPVQSYDNIIFLGSSTSDRAFNSPEALADMQEILQEHGLPTMNLVAETLSGSSAPYQAETLMPQVVSKNAELKNVLFFGQSPTNSINQAFSSEDQSVKDRLQKNIESILTQSNNAGWTTLYSNFNKTPEAKDYEIEKWNDNFLTPIVQSLAPRSIDFGTYIQDYEKLGGWSDHLFSSRDGVHLSEVSGDRLYRQYSAANIARFLGYDTRKSLAGRRVVVQPTSSNPLNWSRFQNITPIPLGLGSAPYRHMGANLVDADTGELLTDLYVVLDGTRGINSGTGNTGNSSSSYLNDKILKKCAWIGVDETEGFYLEIGSFTQTLPTIASLKLAGNRNSSGDDRFGEWVCNGETKLLDGTQRPCGLIDFRDVPAVDNKVTATGTLASGSSYSYLSAIEIQFA